MDKHRRGWLVDKQWLYVSIRGALGAYWHTPIAFVDRVTGKVYSLYPSITNEQARQLMEGDDGLGD